ncbi:hypothetical protein BDY21DRAFT_136724 [Lineolata rhizophorae]|uniref:Zn(2)-C6 fungal-type domain-containing protein n=1 Tax=Lineolata rhizophorae TaxID=578093 RepID=A0A6A6PB76_9PEZI|nr:hypothetical protein BDY21DRAFT_136724 [Lineolata rhizophorae]
MRTNQNQANLSKKKKNPIGTRKLRCSGDYPRCARCARESVECVYSPQKKMGRPRKRAREAEDDEPATGAGVPQTGWPPPPPPPSSQSHSASSSSTAVPTAVQAFFAPDRRASSSNTSAASDGLNGHHGAAQRRRHSQHHQQHHQQQSRQQPVVMDLGAESAVAAVAAAGIEEGHLLDSLAPADLSAYDNGIVGTDDYGGSGGPGGGGGGSFGALLEDMGVHGYLGIMNAGPASNGDGPMNSFDLGVGMAMASGMEELGFGAQQEHHQHQQHQNHHQNGHAFDAGFSHDGNQALFGFNQTFSPASFLAPYITHDTQHAGAHQTIPEEPTLGHLPTTTPGAVVATPAASPSSSSQPHSCMSTMSQSAAAITAHSRRPFPFSLGPLRDGRRAALAMLDCPLCPTSPMSATQNVYLLGALFAMLAERYRSEAAAIEAEAERASAQGTRKRFLLGDMSREAVEHGWHTGSVDCPARFSVELDAAEWRKLAKKVIKEEVLGAEGGNAAAAAAATENGNGAPNCSSNGNGNGHLAVEEVDEVVSSTAATAAAVAGGYHGHTVPSVVELLQRAEDRQERWHADEAMNAMRARLFPGIQQHMGEEHGGHLCFTVFHRIRKNIQAMDWS